MTLKLVNPKSIKQDPRGISLWFNEGERNLYLVHDRETIFYFEISCGTDIIHGENGTVLKYGKIRSDRVEDHFFKGARLVNMVHDVPGPVLADMVNILDDCEDLDSQLKTRILEYLKNRKNTDLILEVPIHQYEQYLADMQKLSVKKKRKFKLKEWQQFLIIFLISVGAMAALLIGGAMYVMKLYQEAKNSGLAP